MRWQYAGVEAQIIEALADIPLRMISYGSNDSDVAFVIKTEDKKRALQALSNRLFEGNRNNFIFVMAARANRLGVKRAEMEAYGEVVQVGTSEEILTEPANDYVARFVENVDRSKIITHCRGA